MDRRFVDRTVIVTGASSGIGAATARRFADEGARVVLVARGEEALKATAESIGRERSLILSADVTDLDRTAELLEQAHRHFGRIDILTNNAGYYLPAPVEQTELGKLMQTVDVDLRAPIALCRQVLPHLRRAGGGAIVNVSSLAGRVPLAGAAVYAAVKFGLRIFSFSLAEELRGSGITVSVVSPGPVDTEFFAGGLDDVPDMAFVPPVRSAEQVAALIAACAHDGKLERAIPWYGGPMSDIGYTHPRVKRAFKPVLERMGKHHKKQYLQKKTEG